MTTYTETSDSKLQSRIRTRYGIEMSILQRLGFSELAFKLETRGPLSALSYLPILPLIRRRFLLKGSCHEPGR